MQIARLCEAWKITHGAENLLQEVQFQRMDIGCNSQVGQA
jgi:hypothetical protein